ncbi:MAG: alanine racemase [Deltaproteobacteria bacterium]|nr:alanine racemase [Deltaproteobacteria bacterium]
MPSYEEWREVLRGERLPAVVVDLEAFDRNVARLVEYLRVDGRVSKALRLATKSVRVPALLERVLKSGVPYKGLMCYSAEEARWLASQGFKDLLLAYPTVQESDLRAVRAAVDAGASLRLMVDSKEGIERAAQAMRGAARPLDLAVDVDASLRLLGGLVHLGVRRSPVRSAADVGRLLDAAAKFPREVRLTGAMAYEAQVAGLGDRNPFKKLVNPVAKLIRALSVRHVARLRAEVAEEFRRRSAPLELFNGGGTGSVNYAAHEGCLTELSAGSGLLCSHLFDYYSNVHFEPACFFALQATRASDDGYVTCQGGGYVASGEPGRDRLPVPHLPKGTKLVAMEGTG